MKEAFVWLIKGRKWRSFGEVQCARRREPDIRQGERVALLGLNGSQVHAAEDDFWRDARR